MLNGSLAQRLRLFSGLILFAFAATHFLNHSLGLFSIETMTEAQNWRTAVTRSLLGGIILGLALLVHIVLALGKLVRRNTHSMPTWELVQIVLGLAIPFLLIPHIVNTRLAHELFGVNDVYFYELVRLWPAKGWNQSILLLLVWVHGCIGLHFWLRLTRWYRRAFPFLLALAVLVPVTSLAGFMVAGRAANVTAGDPAVLEALKSVSNWPNAENGHLIGAYGTWLRDGFYILLGALLLSMIGRWFLVARHRNVPVHYVPTPTVNGVDGATLLEISRMNKVPHASVCGGRARCSTCRVRIIDGAENLPPPSPAEADALRSISADPDVRLACQMRPNGPITVSLLLSGHPGVGERKTLESQGSERVLAILFFDMRGFTTLSDGRLPYDVVFLLNRLFETVGSAVRSEDGWIDKYLGDGLMAVFGRNTTSETACRQAIRCARKIDVALDELNHELREELDSPIQVGMGLHAGPLVLGEIGYRDTASMTVIGRTVNIAARLEAATKELECQFVVSRDAAELAGIDTSFLKSEKLEIRGVADALSVIPIKRARDLNDALEAIAVEGPLSNA